MSKQFTASEVKEAGSVEKGLHIIIDNNVYEMGSFVDEHPGGAKILKRVGGKDASKQFWKVSGARVHCVDWDDCGEVIVSYGSWLVAWCPLMADIAISDCTCDCSRDVA